MAYLNALQLLSPLPDDIDKLWLCTAEPTTFTQASSTYAVGLKTSPTIGTAETTTGSGAQVPVGAITDGEITANGTATHWALTASTTYFGTNVLYAAGPLTAGQLVVDGNTFTLTSFNVAVNSPT
jgi:hypothetical protein